MVPLFDMVRQQASREVEPPCIIAAPALSAGLLRMLWLANTLGRWMGPACAGNKLVAGASGGLVTMISCYLHTSHSRLRCG
jgi:hypothetical protein